MDEWKKDDEELTELEQRLREGLKRVPAPLGLEARVMATAATRGRRRGWMGLRASWAVAATLLLVGAGAVARYERVEQERRAAAVAHEQVVEALHITGAKLDLVRHELNDRNELNDTGGER